MAYYVIQSSKFIVDIRLDFRLNYPTQVCGQLTYNVTDKKSLECSASARLNETFAINWYAPGNFHVSRSSIASLRIALIRLKTWLKFVIEKDISSFCPGLSLPVQNTSRRFWSPTPTASSSRRRASSASRNLLYKLLCRWLNPELLSAEVFAFQEEYISASRGRQSPACNYCGTRKLAAAETVSRCHGMRYCGRNDGEGNRDSHFWKFPRQKSFYSNWI